MKVPEHVTLDVRKRANDEHTHDVKIRILVTVNSQATFTKNMSLAALHGIRN